MMRVVIGAILMVFISTMLVSCGGEGNDIAVPIKKPKVVKKVVEEKVEVVRKTNPEQLDRQPFKSYLAVPLNCSDEQVSDMCPEEIPPLKRYPLHSFKVTTILVMGGNPLGVVVDSKSVKHSVFVGTEIGNRGGKVVEISSGRIVVEEPIRWNDDGDVIALDRVDLKLPESKR